MGADWKQREGRNLKGEFPLVQFLGGSESHAVFVVEKSAGGQRQTAIRVLDANAPGANDQFRQWESAAKLQHPNLVQIFETGRCDIDGKDFFYAWTQYGEEDLAQIFPSRVLSVEETRQILDAVLPALSYLHSQGLVHGSVKPSNIFAVGDTVKLSSDTMRPSGIPKILGDAKSAYDAPETERGVEPPADVWSLGVTLVEALTQKLPAVDTQSQRQPVVPNGTPPVFKEIIEKSLQLDPAKRWTAAQITALLRAAPEESAKAPAASPIRPERPASSTHLPAERKSAKWIYAIVLLAAAVVVAVLMGQHKAKSPSSESTQAQPESATLPVSPRANLPEQSGSNAGPSASSQIASSNRGNTDGMLTLDSRDDVLQRVAPRISPSARRTITGMIRIRLRLNVDANGNVTDARLQSAGPSKYFDRVALEAAREWKFKPAMVNGQAVPSTWSLRFGFSRRSTEAAAERTAP